nr:PREDICTED: beta-microseminoprotein-like [Lepisosteus oculatus]
MKYLLHVAFGILSAALLCNGYCTFEPLIIEDIYNLPTGCNDTNGVLHEFGSEWKTADCFKCSCTEYGIDCCSIILTPVKTPPKCEMIVNKKDCTWKLVLKNDHSKECC